MKTLCCLFTFLCFAVQVPAQSAVMTDVLTGSRWEIQGKWFGADTVFMVRVNTDTTGLRGKELMEKMIDLHRRENISFDSTGKFCFYSDYVYCPVGETLHHLNAFDPAGKQVCIVYELQPWNSDGATQRELTYSILQWEPWRIILALRKN
jgi:hypothetical protein